MNIHKTIHAKPIQIQAGNLLNLRGWAAECLGDHYRATFFGVDAEDRETNTLSIKFSDSVDASFNDRIAKLIEKIGPMLLKPAWVIVRDDTMSGERDSIYFGGPTPESIEKIRIDFCAEAALADINLKGLLHPEDKKIAEAINVLEETQPLAPSP